MQKVLWKETIKCWIFGLIYIPMIFWLKPRIIELSTKRGTLMVPFKRRTKNHVNSMFFGPFATGADVLGGALMLHLLGSKVKYYPFVYKNFYAEFLKRATSDVYYYCEDGQKISDAIALSTQTGERQNVELNIRATTPDVFQDETVANFKLMLSLKYSPRK